MLINNSVLNVKALVGTLNQQKTLVRAFSVIVELCRLIVCSTSHIITVLSCYCTQVRLLLTSCPRLARLGRLVHLAGADRRSFLQLEEEARASNWDLDLVWVTPTSQ